MSRSSLPVSCRELDLAAVEAELVKHRCNVAAAARALGVPASDLRRLVTWGPLAAAVSEQVEQAIDRAEAVLLDGLGSPDALVRLKAASALLTLSPAGRRRGFGRGASAGRKSRPPEDVALKWRDN
jgi:HEAT repeat protein